MKTADRMRLLPPYLFAELDRLKTEARARGVDVVDLGVGDPEQPTPAAVVDRLCREAGDPANHRYPAYEGSALFRRTVAGYYQRRFGVRLDHDREVLAVIGSKEGISHLIWAFVDPGDVVLVPDPAYPVYRSQTLLAGGRPVLMPLEAGRGFFPDFGALRREDLERARIMFLNYPNNPTAAVATREQLAEAVAFARRHDILLCHDAAYVEMTYDGVVAPSVLEVPGAAEVALEFYSLSKPFNMTGWRIGAAVGNTVAVEALGRIKNNTDSGQFTAVQHAAVEALGGDWAESFIREMNAIYRRRRDLVVSHLSELGWEFQVPRGTFYVWAKPPGDRGSAEFASELLERTGVLVPPGTAYGPAGEGYVRIALCIDDRRLEEGLGRLKEGQQGF
ncbi:MAG: LL-diaminopimelate aminotransferase [bacterium]|nr:LL-diaminopimelate aminotransferase [bacterium]